VEYSDGVYAASARLVLDGLEPYRDFAAAQPPGVFYAGAGLLALGDSVSALRGALALVNLATAALVLVVVWRLTGRKAAAWIAGIAALVAPWALREHAQLIPETFGAPLLLGAALAASRPRWSWLAGALGGTAVLFKLPFVLPALAIAAVAASRRAALIALGAMLALGFGAATAGFGSGFWRGAVEAQGQTGLAPVADTARLWSQAAWNLLPFAVPVLMAVQLRRPEDARLFRTVALAAAAGLALLLGLAKDGSYLNAIVVVEPLLVVLAACGFTWLLDERSSRVLAVAAAMAALGVAQVVSLLVSPDDPSVFARPGAATAPGWLLTGAEVEEDLARRRCPPGTASSQVPYLAFAADRRMPGNQPDQFIITQSSANARFLVAANRDVNRCP
jgi:hypothetical protein